MIPGGDVAYLLERARARWGYTRPPIAAAAPRWLGLELVADPRPRSDGLRGAELDDPNLAAVAERLRAWDEGVDSLRLLDHFAPLRSGHEGPGCTSGHHTPDETPGHRLGVFVTIDDATGGAEGVVHELAHQKLHCLGIDIEDHDGRLFRNDSEARWFSPIRRDCPRPFSALLHGVYAYAHVLEVDRRAPDGAVYLAVNVPKVRRGIEEVARAAEPTPAGEAFLGELVIWAETLVELGTETLVELGIAEERWEPVEWERR